MPSPDIVERRREALVAAIRRWAAENGGVPPRVKDFTGTKSSGWPSYLTVIRYSPDNTWDGMIREAGFEPRGRGRPVVL